MDRRLLKGFLCLIYYSGVWISSTAKPKRPKIGLAAGWCFDALNIYAIKTFDILWAAAIATNVFGMVAILTAIGLVAIANLVRT